MPRDRDQFLKNKNARGEKKQGQEDRAQGESVPKREMEPPSGIKKRFQPEPRRTAVRAHCLIERIQEKRSNDHNEPQPLPDPGIDDIPCGDRTVDDEGRHERVYERLGKIHAEVTMEERDEVHMPLRV
ncbi:MAG TPA: hypothetical protein DCS42_04255 [Nitrospiraceae bacterium]|nr:hypothetical protein [Nitrospiraceae bacterium]